MTSNRRSGALIVSRPDRKRATGRASRQSPKASAVRWRIVLVIGLILTGSACKPTPKPTPAPAPTPPSRPTPRPVSNTIDWIGDSNTTLLRAYASDHWRNSVPTGTNFFSADRAGAQIGDHNEAQIERFRSGRPRILIIAEGTNNALKDQWDATDELHLVELMNAAHPRTCIVMVLGGHTDKLAPAKRRQVDIARTRMRILAGQRPSTVVVDWMPMVQEHPEYMSSDGIHLTTTEGLHGFVDVAWAGVRECHAQQHPVKPAPAPVDPPLPPAFKVGRG